jgi:putative flippase GtrA
MASESSPGGWKLALWLRLRSSLVGLVTAASDFGSLALMIYVFDMDERAAGVPSLVPGLVIMFVGNKYFAFDDRSKALVRQTGLFFLIELCGFALNALAYDLLVGTWQMHPMLARALHTFVVYQCFSFPLWKVFVFRYQARDMTEHASAKPPSGQSDA